MLLQDRFLLAIAGLFGLFGVGLAAAASHITGPGQIDVAANIMLFHAPALIGLALVARFRIALELAVRISGWLIALGVGLFAADLCRRGFFSEHLFPMAAPIGGTMIMIGWGAFALTTLFSFKPSQ